MKTIRFIDLFAGIGGFRYGLEAVNRKTNRGSKSPKKNGDSKGYSEFKETNPKRRLSGKHNNGGSSGQEPFTCVYTNEWDKYASQIYKKHFGECDTRDITTVPSSDIPDHDLLCGGFPCQAFSIAGKRRGFEEARGTLFFEIARILRDKRPRYFLLENVKGLLSHDEGKTFQTILGVLSDLGYEYQWNVLNSKNFGVPQNRERVFIVGHLRGTPRPKVFPFTNDSRQTDELPRHIANTITRRYEGAQTTGTYVGEGKLDAQETDASGQGIRPKRNKPDGSDSRGGQAHPSSVRRLTPLECERLQGFPDGWTEGVSDTQRYKCCGNAVTVNVIQAIIEKLT